MSREVYESLICLLGSEATAYAYQQFEATFKPKLPQAAREYLLRAWVALEAMPRDAAAEKHLLRDALCKLRDEWQRPHRKTKEVNDV